MVSSRLTRSYENLIQKQENQKLSDEKDQKQEEPTQVATMSSTRRNLRNIRREMENEPKIIDLQIEDTVFDAAEEKK